VASAVAINCSMIDGLDAAAGAEGGAVEAAAVQAKSSWR